MYFVEWLAWLAYIEPKEEREASEKQNKDFRLKPIYEGDIETEIESAKKPASKTPKSRGPVYDYNEHILEMRCGMWENKRGLISLLSITAIVYSITNIVIVLEDAGYLLGLTLTYNGEPYGELLVMVLVFLTIGFGTLWLYVRFGLRFTRLEMFTSRHLLIRFNRATQQVYLHRPPYCGGIVTLPWHGVTSSGSDKKFATAGGVGLPLALIWAPPFAGALHPEFVHVGKVTNTYQEMQSEWEFIRRFMDEGPEGLPRPHITSHFPWPWQAFTPQFEGLTRYFRKSSRITKLGLVLISPAFLIIGTGHWLSLILCWKPRWPKIIREAGLPGKPIPPLTTLDDHPPHIKERLRENAYMWAARPGKRPERKKRITRRQREAGAQTPKPEQANPHETHRTDRP